MCYFAQKLNAVHVDANKHHSSCGSKHQTLTDKVSKMGLEALPDCLQHMFNVKCSLSVCVFQQTGNGSHQKFWNRNAEALRGNITSGGITNMFPTDWSDLENEHKEQNCRSGEFSAPVHWFNAAVWNLLHGRFCLSCSETFYEVNILGSLISEVLSPYTLQSELLWHAHWFILREITLLLIWT